MNRRYNIGLLSTTLKEIVRAERDEQIHIRSIWVANTTSSVRKITLQHIPAGESTGDGFALFDDLATKAHGLHLLTDTTVYLEPGDRLMASADAASAMALTIYGVSMGGASMTERPGTGLGRGGY